MFKSGGHRADSVAEEAPLLFGEVLAEVLGTARVERILCHDLDELAATLRGRTLLVGKDHEGALRIIRRDDRVDEGIARRLRHALEMGVGQADSFVVAGFRKRLEEAIATDVGDVVEAHQRQVHIHPVLAGDELVDEQSLTKPRAMAKHFGAVR